MTSDPVWAWSGEYLMDLTGYQALKMVAESFDGTDYLFVETGGFKAKHKPVWKSLWMVMTR